MTTLAVDTPRVFELGDTNELVSSTAIKEGAFVGAVKANGTAAAGAMAIATHAFAGVAVRGCVSGDRVRLRTRGKVVMPVAGASAASLGAIVYLSDDDTLTLTGGGVNTQVPVGYVSRHISGTTCLVEFSATAERDTAIA